MITGTIIKIHEFTDPNTGTDRLQITVDVVYPLTNLPFHNETREQFTERVKKGVDNRFMYDNLHLGMIKLEQDIVKYLTPEDIADEYYEPTTAEGEK